MLGILLYLLPLCGLNTSHANRLSCFCKLWTCLLHTPSSNNFISSSLIQPFPCTKILSRELEFGTVFLMNTTNYWDEHHFICHSRQYHWYTDSCIDCRSALAFVYAILALTNGVMCAVHMILQL